MKGNVLSLLCTVYNEEDSILPFLESFSNQSINTIELVIVDGGSKDSTAFLIKQFREINRHLNINLIIDPTCNKENSKGPIAKGRNVGFRHVKTDWVLVTDAGCTLHSKFIEESINFLHENPNANVVSGIYLIKSINKFQKIYSEIVIPDYNKITPSEFNPSSRNLLIRKDIWKLVGGYPEHSITGEDTLFNLKIRKLGYDFLLNKRSIVYWNAPQTFSDSLLKQYRYGYGDGLLRNFVSKSLFAYLKMIFFPSFLLYLIFFPKTGWLKYSLLVSNQLGYTKGFLNSIFTAE